MDTLAIIRSALQYTGKDVHGEIKRYHFSNHAVNQALKGDGNNGIIELHRTWEDSDIYGQMYALELANSIDGLIPGEWVLIDTGDYITNEKGLSFGNYETDTYDPDYALILVYKSTFAEYRQALEEVDRQWRTERQGIANGELTPVAA